MFFRIQLFLYRLLRKTVTNSITSTNLSSRYSLTLALDVIIDYPLKIFGESDGELLRDISIYPPLPPYPKADIPDGISNITTKHWLG